MSHTLFILIIIFPKQEVDSVEQRLTMSKFELAELRKIHEELMLAINTTKKENKAIVEPALEKIRQQVCLSVFLSVGCLITVSIYNRTIRYT